MEIKKTKFVRKSELTKSNPFKRSRIMKLRQQTFKQRVLIGNTKIIIHSELCRLTSDERRQWYKEEAEKGNPVVLAIQRAIRDCYR